MAETRRSGVSVREANAVQWRAAHPARDGRLRQIRLRRLAIPGFGTDAAVGGTWTYYGGSNETAFATDGGNRRIELDAGPGGFVRYAPSSASSAGYAVRVKGRAQLVAEPGVPETPISRPSPPLAGLALGTGDDGTTLYGWTGGGWIALKGSPVGENEWIDWNATIDFTASQARLDAGMRFHIAGGARIRAAAQVPDPIPLDQDRAIRPARALRSLSGGFTLACLPSPACTEFF